MVKKITAALIDSAMYNTSYNCDAIVSRFAQTRPITLDEHGDIVLYNEFIKSDTKEIKSITDVENAVVDTSISRRLTTTNTSKTRSVKLCSVRSIRNMNDPSISLMLKVGCIDIWGRQFEDLWYWDNKYWLFAKTRDGIPYYVNKKYAIYEVKIQFPDKLAEIVSKMYLE